MMFVKLMISSIAPQTSHAKFWADWNLDHPKPGAEESDWGHECTGHLQANTGQGQS